MNMIEKVARTLANTYHGRECSDAYIFGEATGGLVFVDMARAAIEAMREPTEEMIVAGLSRSNGFASAGNRMCNGYRGMIDAALSEDVTSPTSSGVPA